MNTIDEIRAYNLKEKEARYQRRSKHAAESQDYYAKHPDRVILSQWRSLIRRILREGWMTPDDLAGELEEITTAYLVGS